MIKVYNKKLYLKNLKILLDSNPIGFSTFVDQKIK